MNSKKWSGLALAAWLGGCCFSPGAFTPVGTSGGVAYTADRSLPTWSPEYAPTMMSDGNPSTYWCTPSGPTFPISATLSLTAPTNVAGVDFDTRLPGYDTSAVREVTLEAFAGGTPVAPPATWLLAQNAVTSVPLVAAGVTSLRVTFRSNFGGTYAGLSELTIRTTPGIGLPATPAATPVVPSGPAIPTPPVAGRGLPFTVDATIPTWNESYSAAMMQDGNPSTYWCSPASPTYPVVTNLTFSFPMNLTGVTFDTTNTGYPNIGPRNVILEGIDAVGNVVGATTGIVGMNTVTTISFPMPVYASYVRLTMLDNHGGGYLGITELSVVPMPILPPG